jgi:hypothetical protein
MGNRGGKILNEGEAEPTDKSANIIAQELNSQVLKLYGKFLNEKGTAVDYKGLGLSEEFKELKSKTLLLRNVDLSALDEDEKLAFFINLYNVLVIHANVEIGFPKSAMQRSSFFSGASYQIGPHVYSLNDIEHGILRANRKHPGSLTNTWSHSDPRTRFMVEKFDPRIHFALVCGAKSCPPIRIFKKENVQDAMQKAALNFCQTNVTIKPNKKEIWLSKIFMWYSGDFGANQKEVLLYIRQFLEEEQQNQLDEGLEKHYSVKYEEYDWGTNE